MENAIESRSSIELRTRHEDMRCASQATTIGVSRQPALIAGRVELAAVGKSTWRHRRSDCLRIPAGGCVIASFTPVIQLLGPNPERRNAPSGGASPRISGLQLTRTRPVRATGPRNRPSDTVQVTSSNMRIGPSSLLHSIVQVRSSFGLHRTISSRMRGGRIMGREPV